MTDLKGNYSSDYYQTLDLYKKLHSEGTEFETAKNTFDGKSLKFFFNPIKQVIELTKSKSIIDFGCGKARYYFEEIIINNTKYKNVVNYWNISDCFLYDPGVKEYSIYPPKKADGVICVDVVEHIPDNDVINFVEELFSLANNFVFIVIACYPARKILPDGRNVHLSIKDTDEWREIISRIKIKYKHISAYVICSTERNKFIALS